MSVTAPYSSSTARVITLYVDGYFVNQWDASVMCALEEKQLVYSTARALLRDGGGVTAALAGRTNIARVPAMQHGDVWLSESSAIIEYLEEMFSPPAYPRLLPADLHARAKARQWMAFVRSDVMQLRIERSWWRCVYDAPDPPPLSREAERDARELVELVTRLWTQGELDPAHWNMGHADLALTLLRLWRTKYPLTDAAKTFLEVNVARPSMRAYLEHPRPPFPPPDAHAAG